MSDDGYPKVRVTMLGNSGSGKTTYLVGMYAEMAAGVARYYLTSGHDTHVELTSAWSALLERGLLPNATESSKSFEFTFRYGAQPLLGLDWIDYRGGAISSSTSDAVTGQLLERIPMSDSLYLTIDGQLWRSVLANEQGARSRLRSVVGLYNNLLGEVTDRRLEANLTPPSIVLLLTKSDLLIDHMSGDSAERRRQVRDWIYGQFALAFEDGRDCAVCPVSLGELGDVQQSKVDTHLVDPMRIHIPIVFTLYSYYRRAAAMFEQQAAQIAAFGASQQADLERFPSGIRRVLGRSKLRELTESHARAAELARTLHDFAGACENRVRVLESELLDVDMFIDGEWVGAP